MGTFFPSKFSPSHKNNFFPCQKIKKQSFFGTWCNSRLDTATVYHTHFIQYACAAAFVISVWVYVLLKFCVRLTKPKLSKTTR